MIITDAANILGLYGYVTKSDIKRAYRTCSFKYHPDRGGSNHMMQAVNKAYDTLKGFEGTIEDGGQVNYGDKLNYAINEIIDFEGISIEVCGAWVWVTGNTKPYAKKLGRKEGGAGFYYASKKKAWYFRPENWKSKSRGSWSLDEIREKHGSDKVNRALRTKPRIATA